MTNEERKALVERLRSVDVSWSETGEWCAQAADLISADCKRIVDLNEMLFITLVDERDAKRRIATLEAALKEIVDNCGECGGYGTYPAEETVTGKVLWWDCSNGSCNTARAALGETK